MSQSESAGSPPPEDGQPLSKRAAKRRRQAEARRLDRERRRPYLRAAALCAGFALAAVAVAVGLGFLDLAEAALWTTGPAGLLVLATVGILVAVEAMKKHKKDRFGAVGWGGLVLSALCGGSLLALFTVFLVTGAESKYAFGLAVFTGVFGFGALGYALTSDVPDVGDSNRAVVEMMNDISDSHN